MFHVHDHYLMTTWNVKSGQIFELLDQESECFDTSQVYSAIKNHRIHVTTFSVLLSVKSAQIKKILPFLSFLTKKSMF